eukprot:Skav229330  [mRNA]  locus=scaffold2917:69352:73753:- [translate_table: standard]
MLARAAAHCTSLSEVGRALWWLLVNAAAIPGTARSLASLQTIVETTVGKEFAMHRGWGIKSQSLFPIPLGDLSAVWRRAKAMELGAFCSCPEGADFDEDVWLALTLSAVSGVAGKNRAPRLGQPNALQQRAISSMRGSVKRTLANPAVLHRAPADAEKELSSRFLSYTGEEVPKMQVITLKQVSSALPPASHSGSIDALELLCEGSRKFLLSPEESLLDNVPPTTTLKSRVHIQRGDELELAQLLVERRICVWVHEDDVLVVNQTKVLNGLFAVGKGSFLDSGEEVQRLIMNLVPTNAVLRQTQGATAGLPGITQYLGLVASQSDELVFYQSDMSAAFYLFRIPPCWNRMMAFNLSFPGHMIGLDNDEIYHLGCAVIPMGWGSSVSIMQEIADRLTVIAKLPQSHKVRRTAPLPSWLVEASEAALAMGTAWYHVYLDNFCAMSRATSSTSPVDGAAFHDCLERAWAEVGILSSAKKRVAGQTQVLELGALVDGQRRTIGGSSERILKLVQTTLVVISKPRLRQKWVQVVVGRWVHLFSFRRPLMVVLDEVWKFQVAQVGVKINFSKVRAELFGCCILAMLLHTDLSAQISTLTSASDASSGGGAVGYSRDLSEAGKEFVTADRQQVQGGLVIPVMVISLFNGIGCAFRCYDLVGVQPMVGISYEISKEANRVTSRRWPWVLQFGNVKEFTIETARDLRYRFPEVLEIHLWGGFPCVDLSSVRFMRQNLQGPESGLFWELVRVLKVLRQVFGYSFPVLHFAENVASMDREAAQEISEVLGSKPYRVDSAQSVPIHRPRFCWTNVEIHPLEDVWLEEKEHWVEVNLCHAYPTDDQWLTEGAVWPYSGEAVFPTAMKAIPRVRPPPRPAGLNRVGQDAILRWQADDFRFPPYQYDDRFVIWVNNKWRLLSSSEREVLHGLGIDHTSLCWNAGRIKDDPVGYEDVRRSLVGDSFNCFSFVYFAAMASYKWLPPFTYAKLVSRMGLAPGFNCPLSWSAPLTRKLTYGLPAGDYGVQHLHQALLRRVNHTGSDVRISTGVVMNSKCFPRQSVNAAWWLWKKGFAYRWKRSDHINSLEFRSIVHAIEWRLWPGHATRADRRRARRHIVLSDVGITKSTLGRYYLAVRRMARVLRYVQSEADLDESVSEWIQQQFERGHPLHLVGDALSGIHHFEPWTRKRLPKSWRLYSIWRRYEVPFRAPPLTQDLTLAMAGWCLQRGELTMAALLLLGFHALLRTGELLQVRPVDFLLDKKVGLVTLPSSKSGVRNNSRESVSLHDPIVLATVSEMVQLKFDLHQQRLPCWDRSGSAFRALFRRALQALEADHLGMRPCSLRRGGATFEMQSHGLMERTLIRGRWKNSNVARLYICDGLSLLPTLKLSWAAKHKVAKFSAVFTAEQQSFS